MSNDNRHDNPPTAPASEKQRLDEAYVVQPQKYTLPTDQLTERTKKTHQAYFEQVAERLNTTTFKLQGADREGANADSSTYRTLKRDEADGINRVFLHGLYFDNISDLRSQITSDMLCFNRLQRDWGTFDRWQEDFIATCKSSRNGWAVTAYCYLINRYINIVVDEESSGVPFGCIPLIVMDMHEHAYFHDYLMDKQLYVNAMMLELDWQTINARFEKAERVGDILQPRTHRSAAGASPQGGFRGGVL